MGSMMSGDKTMIVTGKNYNFLEVEYDNEY